MNEANSISSLGDIMAASIFRSFAYVYFATALVMALSRDGTPEPVAAKLA